MSNQARLRSSTQRYLSWGITLVTIDFAADILGSLARGNSDDVNVFDGIGAASFAAGSFLIVAGGCKLIYDLAQIARRKPATDSLPFQPDQVRARPSTVITGVLGVSLIGTYYYLCVNHIAGFGEPTDIRGGSLPMMGAVLIAVSVGKRKFELRRRR